MAGVRMPDSSDSPDPATNGEMLRCNSSTRPASNSARLNGPLPYFTKVPSPESLSWATASTASPTSTSAFHVVSVSVVEATCLGNELILLARSPVMVGQVPAKPESDRRGQQLELIGEVAVVGDDLHLPGPPVVAGEPPVDREVVEFDQFSHAREPTIRLIGPSCTEP